MSGVIELWPLRGLHRPGDTVEVAIKLSGDFEFSVLSVTISHLDEVVDRFTVTPIGSEAIVSWTPPPIAPRGYGIEVLPLDDGGPLQAGATTSFEVLESWTDHPHYGFLHDFSPERDNWDETFSQMLRFHINGIQFYDWMYRHDDPLPPGDEFTDPLGRRLSFSTITELVERAATLGIAPMAYMAVYASSLSLWEAMPDWALYDGSGDPMRFGDSFLGLMNPTRGSAWTEHLLDRCAEVLESLPFAGIHIDQYGEPREGFDAEGHPVDIPEAFHNFIVDVRRRLPRSPTTFNAVKNWPIQALVTAPMDFVYIELWPDTPAYRDLARIVADAHTDSGDKSVIVALYIPANQPANVLTANSVIGSNGGSRIEIGEPGVLLTDPYFPESDSLSEDLQRALRAQADFRVRYCELFGAGSSPVSADVRVQDDVWVTARRSGPHLALHLVNMTGLVDEHWSRPHSDPGVVNDLEIIVEIKGSIEGIFWASPDQSGSAQSLPWDADEGSIRIVVPELARCGLICISEEGAH